MNKGKHTPTPRRNKTAIDPIMRKGHAHRSKKDYNRQAGKRTLEKLVQESRHKE